MGKNSYGSRSVKIGILAIFFAFSNPSFAETPAVLNASDLSARFQQLEAQITSLQKEVETLRQQVEIKGPQAEEKAVYVAPGAETGPKWLEGLTMGGDLRLRYEGIDQTETTRDRNRFRYRLRWKVEKRLSDDLDLGFRLVSGSSTDPTSTNQSFTDNFTYKSILVDQVYVKYRPSFLKEHIPGLEKSEIAGGKFENPFFATSTGLVWDGDLMPEGFYETLQFGFFDDKVKPFVTLGQFILQENTTLADAELYGFQTGFQWTPPGFSEDSGAQLTHALAYYDFSEYAKDSNFIVSGTSLARGNSGAGSTLFAGDFDILQIYNELQFKVSGFPVKLFGDFATNLADRAPDPLDRDVGYEYGIKLGSAKKKGDWEASYYYAYIEPNAVVGAFNDSDFGAGHANKRGSAFQLKYKLTDSLKAGFTTYFVNNVTGADDETRRFQTDLEWTF